MDYYIVINGQKQGPFDLLGFMKKVRNGVVTKETLVATNENGPFVPAVEIAEIRDILQAETVTATSADEVHFQQSSLKFKTVMSDAVDLWMRKVISYTLIFGAITVLGFMFAILLNSMPFLSGLASVVDYLVGVFTITMVSVFYYYVLVTRRSQEMDFKDLKGVLKTSFMPLLSFALILSVPLLFYGLSKQASVVTIVAILFMLSFMAFIPFLIVDHRMRLRRAMRVSIESFKSMSTGTLAIIFALVGFNIAAALIPGIVSPELGILGLMISVPITVAALASIYDQVIA